MVPNVLYELFLYEKVLYEIFLYEIVLYEIFLYEMSVYRCYFIKIFYGKLLNAQYKYCNRKLLLSV